MYSFLSRHKENAEKSKGYGDGCGQLMYDAWGGASALSWAEAKINSIEKATERYLQRRRQIAGSRQRREYLRLVKITEFYIGQNITKFFRLDLMTKDNTKSI